jgi:hypothetical protein
MDVDAKTRETAGAARVGEQSDTAFGSVMGSQLSA